MRKETERYFSFLVSLTGPAIRNFSYAGPQFEIRLRVQHKTHVPDFGNTRSRKRKQKTFQRTHIFKNWTKMTHFCSFEWGGWVGKERTTGIFDQTFFQRERISKQFQHSKQKYSRKISLKLPEKRQNWQNIDESHMGRKGKGGNWLFSGLWFSNPKHSKQNNKLSIWAK